MRCLLYLYLIEVFLQVALLQIINTLEHRFKLLLKALNLFPWIPQTPIIFTLGSDH